MLRCGGSCSDPQHCRRDILPGHRLRATVKRLRRRRIAARAHQRKLGLDHARLDRRDAHSGAVQIAAQPERKLLHERLRSRIDVAARIRISRRDRRQVDDGAAPGDQPRQQFVSERHERRHIRVDHRFPLGEIGGLRRIAPEREPGVVDQKVDATKSVGKRGQRRVACGFVGDVERGGMHLVGADSVDQRLEAFGSAAGRDDPPPAAVNARAAASPMPEVAPVMRAVLPMPSPFLCGVRLGVRERRYIMMQAFSRTGSLSRLSLSGQRIRSDRFTTKDTTNTKLLGRSS